MDLQIRMCLGKRTYDTKKMAEGVMYQAKKRGIIVTKSMHAYKCPFCSKFHLGHNKGGS
jgi:hypothetical protein